MACLVRMAILSDSTSIDRDRPLRPLFLPLPLPLASSENTVRAHLLSDVSRTISTDALRLGRGGGGGSDPWAARFMVAVLTADTGRIGRIIPGGESGPSYAGKSCGRIGVTPGGTLRPCPPVDAPREPSSF